MRKSVKEILEHAANIPPYSTVNRSITDIVSADRAMNEFILNPKIIEKDSNIPEIEPITSNDEGDKTDGVASIDDSDENNGVASIDGSDENNGVASDDESDNNNGVGSNDESNGNTKVASIDESDVNTILSREKITI